MADDGLEALVRLIGEGFPELDCSVCRSRDEDVHAIDLSKDEPTDITFVALRRIQFDHLKVSAAVDKPPVVLCFLFIVVDAAIGESDEHQLLLFRVNE